MKLVDQSLRDVLAAFSSPNPTPGGGSGSALASALGVSLLMMVGGLPKTRTGAAEERTALASATETLAEIRQRLTDAVDADAAAYDQVVAAYKLPKASADEQATRKAAIDGALRAATDAPLGVMRLSSAALGCAESIAAHGHRAAGSDVEVALVLIRAGFEGGRVNVDVNLCGIRDETYAAAVRDEVERLANR